jgi:hypothetical protein
MDEHSGRSLRHVIMTGRAGFIGVSREFVLPHGMGLVWADAPRGLWSFRPCDMGSTT